MTAHHTDFVRANRERWFREVRGAREAYLTNEAVRLVTDSVDAALSMVDREMAAENIAADVRKHVLTVAVFGTVYDYGTRPAAVFPAALLPGERVFPNPASPCPRCKGSGIDPEYSSPGCTDPDRGAEPPNLEPCIACQYPLRSTEN